MTLVRERYYPMAEEYVGNQLLHSAIGFAWMGDAGVVRQVAAGLNALHR